MQYLFWVNQKIWGSAIRAENAAISSSSAGQTGNTRKE
jgi:hypothetical protein